MRGLSPDHTLVLVNGIRRHRSSLVHTFAFGEPAGATGVAIAGGAAGHISRDQRRAIRRGRDGFDLRPEVVAGRQVEAHRAPAPPAIVAVALPQRLQRPQLLLLAPVQADLLAEPVLSAVGGELVECDVDLEHVIASVLAGLAGAVSPAAAMT